MNRATVGLAAILSTTAMLVACKPGAVTPQVTSVGRSVATLVKTSGIQLGEDCGPSTPAAPDIPAWWSGLQPSNHQYPFAGYETWRDSHTNCTKSRLDVYRAVVTFNMASISNLKGLVTKAELIVATRALPASARRGGVVTVGPLGVAGSITLMCPDQLGGAGALVRFGPNAGPLPNMSGSGELHQLPAPDPFPTGTNTVYTFPQVLSAGPLSGATDPTTLTASGNGGSVFATDVTGAVNAALNANMPGLSWMLTSNFEGPLPAALPMTAGNVDCKTSYEFDLRVTHL